MKRAKKPVSVAGIEFDALMSEEWEYTAQVPEYATDEGYSVSDSILLESETLTMELYLSDTPVTWYGRSGHGSNHTEKVISQLQALFLKKTPVKVVTSYGTYKNMAIESLKISKSMEDGYSRKIPISFRKIRTTKVKTVTIPSSYGKSGTTSSSSGTANTTSKSTSSGSSSSSSSSSSSGKSSILYSLGKKTKVIK